MLGLGQPVHIVQHQAILLGVTAQFEVQLAPGAQPKQKDPQAQPDQELLVVGHKGLESSVGQLTQPLAQVRPEVVDRLHEGPAHA